MSRPLLLATAALVVGIVAADCLFYCASVAVPWWSGWVLWGVCALLALLAVVDYRRRRQPVWRPARRFAVWVALFFVVAGFQRYASVAQQTRARWAQLAHPPTNRGNPDEMDYRRWRWLQGEPDSTSWQGRWRQRALQVRRQMIARYRLAGLQEQTLAVVAAMTLGDRSLLTSGTRDLYAAAGASHLLALSGLHLGILTGVLFLLVNSWLLRSRWRWLAALLAVCYVWAFALVAGLPASLVRAAVMSSFFLAASLLQRHTSTLNLLLLAALVMLLFWPPCLFDVGAQLSFLAVLGIAVVFRPVWQWAFERWRSAFFWMERYGLTAVLSVLGVSVCAQLFTLPVVMVTFHRVPLYGTVFSLLLIPLSTLLIYTALAVLLLSGLWLSAGRVAAVALTWLVAAQMWVMRVETSLPGACIEDFWSRKAEPQLVIYHNRRCPALHLIASPQESYLLMPQPERADSGMSRIRRDFWRRRLTAEPRLLTGRHTVAAAGVKAVMVGGSGGSGLSGRPQLPAADAAVHVDVLWLTRGFRGSRLDEVAGWYAPRLVVLDASLPGWQRRALRTAARRRGWAVHDVAEQGAFRMSLESEK